MASLYEEKKSLREVGALTSDRFQVVRYLGEGSFGKVEKVRDQVTGAFYATKKFKDPSGTIPAEALRELNVLASIKHPNVVSSEFIFMDQCTPVCVLELMDDGDLRQYIKENKVKDPINIFLQLACGVSALHANSLIHRDLKPENCLIKGDRVVVADLDCLVSPTNTEDIFLITTLWYRAPEILCERVIQLYNRSNELTRSFVELIWDSKSFSNKVDIWALGLIFYELFTGRHLLELTTSELDPEDQYISLIEQRIYNYQWFDEDEKKTYYGLVPKEHMPIMMKMLSLNPDDRPTAGEIIQHFSYSCLIERSPFKQESIKSLSIDLSTRRNLLEYLYDLNIKKNMNPLTWFTAVEMIDRSAVKRKVPLDKYQAHGAAALMIASKLFVGNELTHTQAAVYLNCTPNLLEIEECRLVENLNFQLYRINFYVESLKSAHPLTLDKARELLLDQLSPEVTLDQSAWIVQ